MNENRMPTKPTLQVLNLIRPVVSIALLLSFVASSFAATAPPAGTGQLGVPVTWIEVPGSRDQFFMAQRSRDGRLYLTPNEAFFPQLGLAAAGTGTVADVDNLNGGMSFAKIEKWDDRDVAEWGLFLANRGELQIRVWMTAASSHGRFTLRLGEMSESFSTQQTQQQPVVVATAKLRVSKPGPHLLELICEKAAPNTALHWIEVSSQAAKNGAVLRKRWRPAAAHTKFSNSKSTENVRLWVMEMDAVPGRLGFYCPITTPFGYYGPTWRADGTVNTSFNFSLWSFGRGQPEPPVEQLSHLLAVGDPKASFDGFSHEGTGVKIRNWEPLEGRQGQRQVVALRVEPGRTYDRYISYFYAAEQKQWKLFGVGNKFNKQKPLKSLWVGSFVEVPGRPHVQRTGPYERVMRYRGWVMTADGVWNVLDRMAIGNVNRETGLTHTDRGVTDDGWFYLQTGGWKFRKGRSKGYVQLDTRQRSLKVDYLNKDDITFLTTVPSEITSPVVQRAGNVIRGEFSVRNAAQNPQVTLYWGTTEALTFADRWQNSVALEGTREGKNQFVIRDASPDKTVFIRLLLKNSEGKFWTPTTSKVEPDGR